MTLCYILRITRLVHRFGITPAQAAVIAGLPFGDDE